MLQLNRFFPVFGYRYHVLKCSSICLRGSVVVILGGTHASIPRSLFSKELFVSKNVVYHAFPASIFFSSVHVNGMSRLFSISKTNGSLNKVLQI